MNTQEKEFLRWYKRRFESDLKLPCLRCTNKKILRCANVALEKNIGCTRFQDYLGLRTT